MGNTHDKIDKSLLKELELELEVKIKIERSIKQSEVDYAILKKAQNGEWTEDKRLKTFYFYYLMDNGILRPEFGTKAIVNRERAKAYLESLGNNKQRVKEVVDACDTGTKVMPPSDRPFQFCKCLQLQQHGVPIDVLKNSR